MKILHLIPDLSNVTGGPVAAVKAMSLSQVALGHDVSIATTKYGKNENLNLKDVRTLYFKCDIGAIRYSRDLKKYLKSNVKNFDIVHIHTIWQYPTHIAGKICLKYKVPYILRPCGMLDKWSFEQKYYKKLLYYSFFEKRTIKNASAIHCTSKAEVQEAQKYLVNNNIFILPLGVNVLAKTEKNSNAKPYILYLSRLHYKKQPDLLIKAFSKIKYDYPDYELILAGPCEHHYLNELKDVVLKKGLQSKVIFKGLVVGTEKEELLRNADLFILPSLQENFGIAVAEAMGSGLPVIIGEKVALAEDIIKHNAGLVIEPAVDNIEKALRELLNSPEKRKIMGKNGYKFVKENFSNEKIAKQLIEKYRQVIDKNEVAKL